MHLVLPTSCGTHTNQHDGPHGDAFFTFRAPPFRHAGLGAEPDIPPNGLHAQGRVNVVPPLLSETQGIQDNKIQN